MKKAQRHEAQRGLALALSGQLQVELELWHDAPFKVKELRATPWRTGRRYYKLSLACRTFEMRMAEGGVLAGNNNKQQQQTVALKFWFNANWFWHRLANSGGRSTHTNTHTQILSALPVESLCNKYFCLFLLE